MTKTRQPQGTGKGANRRGINLTDDEITMLLWLADSETRSRSNMVGRLIRMEYERRGGPVIDVAA